MKHEARLSRLEKSTQGGGWLPWEPEHKRMEALFDAIVGDAPEEQHDALVEAHFIAQGCTAQEIQEARERAPDGDIETKWINWGTPQAKLVYRRRATA
jgi:enhancing lycopene biosynthesis protein 2